MRFLHVINTVSGSGGAEQGMVREISLFDPEIEQRVVTLYQPGTLQSRLEEAGIVCRSLGLNSSNSGWNWVSGAKRLRDIVGDYRPDVVHSSLASGNLVAQLATRRSGVPVVSTLTLSGDPTLMRQLQPGADTMRASAMRKVGAAAARLDHVWFRSLTHDSADTTATASRIDMTRVEVIPRGVPLPDLTRPGLTRLALGLPADGALMLNVGRQTAQKGHTDLIATFEQVLSAVPAHLVILGREGDGSAALRRSIESSHLEEQVTVLPYVENPYDYYRAADVFVFPSYMEGLGTAVLEAMANGLPVIGYDIPPVREIVEDREVATLVEVGDIDGLTSAVIATLSDRSAAVDRAASARQLIESRYSLPEVARRLQTFLVDVASHVES